MECHHREKEEGKKKIFRYFIFLDRNFRSQPFNLSSQNIFFFSKKFRTEASFLFQTFESFRRHAAFKVYSLLSLFCRIVH